MSTVNIFYTVDESDEVKIDKEVSLMCLLLISMLTTQLQIQQEISKCTCALQFKAEKIEKGKYRVSQTIGHGLIVVFTCVSYT